ncbi:MAG TPA: bifunctional nuclease family protein [Spirochaetota bacterium]|nr:bifunctional nuclease family protein [Spirochaetota bacterium]HQO02807.1 bifunctional nuclease family protein [Spirochaetota bacterium]HQP48376.1 bifunctional nuclease family protein [Spirochaetota bacterium]
MPVCEVQIVNIFVDKDSGTPVVLLRDPESKDVLPILIAPLEASMIAIELEGQKPVRPLTHDLIINVVKELAYEVKSVCVTDLRDNIYFAEITLVCGDRVVEIDSRPSDAIAVALRAGCSIFVKRKVFALAMGISNVVKSGDREAMKEVLEDIDIEDVDGKIM